MGEDGQPLPEPEEDEDAPVPEGEAEHTKKSNFKKYSFKEDKRLAVLVHQVCSVHLPTHSSKALYRLTILLQ